MSCVYFPDVLNLTASNGWRDREKKKNQARCLTCQFNVKFFMICSVFCTNFEIFKMLKVKQRQLHKYLNICRKHRRAHFMY